MNNGDLCKALLGSLAAGGSLAPAAQMEQDLTDQDQREYQGFLNKTTSVLSGKRNVAAATKANESGRAFNSKKSGEYARSGCVSVVRSAV